jgi:integrase
MKKVEVPFLRKFGRTWHWQPSAAARKLGFVSVALGSDDAIAVRKAGQLWQEYQAKKIIAVSPRSRGTFDHLKQAYYESDEWAALEPDSKRDYKRYIEKQICRRWGSEQVKDLDAEVVKALHKSMKARPFAANQCVKVLKEIIRVAMTMPSQFPGLTENPCANIKLYGKKEGVKPRDRIWADWEIDAFDHAADDEMLMAMLLYRYTGQRTSDVIKMKESDYKIDADGDRWLHVFQKKTGKQLWIYCHSDLWPAIEAHMAKHRKARPGRTDAPLIQNTKGRQFGRRRFVAHWDDTAVKAKIVTLSGEKGVRRDRSNPTRHDLRRYATTRLAEVGCTHEQISSITGLSLSMIRTQTYNVRTKAQSKAGIKKLERNR